MKKTFPTNKRNAKLIQLFSRIFHNCTVELVGNENQPKIIIHSHIFDEDGKVFLVSGFCKNFIFNFTTKHFGGEVVDSIDITLDYDIEDYNNFRQYVQKVFLVAIDCKFSSENKILYYYNTDVGEPMFSFNKMRYFFTKEDAITCIDYLSDSHNLESYII